MQFLLPLMLILGEGEVLSKPQVLVVTATAGYRHESIPTAEHVLGSIAGSQGAEVSYIRTAEDMERELTLATLDQVKVVIFANTSGELPASAAEAVTAWVRQGGTFVGFHSASDTWHSIPDYLEMLGGEFVSHPAETNAIVVVDDVTHPATVALPVQYELYEEFYYLGRVTLPQIRPLLSLRARPEPPGDVGYYPLAWEKPFGRGRVLYTALGHREDVWLSEWFQRHVTGILAWALNRPPAHTKRRAVR